MYTFKILIFFSLQFRVAYEKIVLKFNDQEQKQIYGTSGRERGKKLSLARDAFGEGKK